MINALILQEKEQQTIASVQQIAENALPNNDVTVDIQWSSLNYKDALAITGKGKVIRQFPMVPGIDFAGIVSQSNDPRFIVGQSVLLTGWGVGENHWGGLAQQAKVKGDWLVPMPEGLDSRKAMIIGTAGLTAMLCVMALEEGQIMPETGKILVTGASGGVGSTAIALLASLGYPVTALTGKETSHNYLRSIGASRIINRSDYTTAGRPLEKQLWAGAIDTVGGQILANVLAQMHYHSTVAACGLANSYQLPTTVMPFILRNVRLQGVDSVMVNHAKRQQAWQRLAQLLPTTFYQQVAREISLEETIQTAEDLLANKITGRILVKIK